SSAADEYIIPFIGVDGVVGAIAADENLTKAGAGERSTGLTPIDGHIASVRSCRRRCRARVGERSAVRVVIRERDVAGGVGDRACPEHICDWACNGDRLAIRIAVVV